MAAWAIVCSFCPRQVGSASPIPLQRLANPSDIAVTKDRPDALDEALSLFSHLHRKPAHHRLRRSQPDRFDDFLLKAAVAYVAGDNLTGAACSATPRALSDRARAASGSFCIDRAETEFEMFGLVKGDEALGVVLLSAPSVSFSSTSHASTKTSMSGWSAQVKKSWATQPGSARFAMAPLGRRRGFRCASREPAAC